MERDVIKRAFELAPECESMTELKRKLIAENFEQVNAHLSFRQIRRDLMCRLKRS
jgi:hypothetical protein